MKNNLIFNNGASFPLCRTDATDVPRMIGWRMWHIEATNDDAVAALNSGLVGREYESVTGRDEAGNPITETMREDLSANTVSGLVCDHRDGTVTVFARRPTELERTSAERQAYADSLDILGVDTANIEASTETRISGIRELTSTADLTGKDSVIVNMPPNFCVEWTPGTTYRQGQLVSYQAVKYLLLQTATAQSHQPPNMPNGAMLSIYKPYQGREHYTWLYGEYTEVGFTRYDGAELYVCIQDPGANIYPPSQVPACWTVDGE